MDQELEIVKLVNGMKLYDFLCLVPLYLSTRSVIRQKYRNIWILFSAQAAIILYLFDCDAFVTSSQLLSFSFLLWPIAIDSYKGTVYWTSDGFFERLDGVAHLVTACMLVYQHPYESEGHQHLWFIVASTAVGFLLGFTARQLPQPAGKTDKSQ